MSKYRFDFFLLPVIESSEGVESIGLSGSIQ